MKILQLCNKPPYPPLDGGSLAMNSITQGLLAAGHQVHVLTVRSDKHPVKEDLLTEQYKNDTHLRSVYVDLNVHPLDAFLAMMCGEAYHVKRYISNDFAEQLIDLLSNEHFDIVHIETIFLTPYVEIIRKHSDAKIVLRAHNVEHQIWRQLARNCKDPLKAWYMRHLSLTLRAYEIEHINDYDGIVCITQQDANHFKTNGCRRPLTTIPFAIAPEPTTGIDEEPASLFHIGSMDWQPNIDSIDWLLKDIWPRIHSEAPQARLYLAGRKMPKRLLDYRAEGVSIIGEVPDALYFIGSKQINIVPLRSGSGIRVKIIEAMSAAKTVIATTVAAQGIDYTDGQNILIANTPNEFAAQVKRCVEEPGLCQRIGQNAYSLIVTQYESTTLTAQLVDFYNLLLV
ncbi:MAG: glycosyltransferase [Bacteroidales bacterium]|nr:glycosyltransferase [Bacteroidales bacterium]